MTFQELKNEILQCLDRDTSTSDDISARVETELQSSMRRMAVRFLPEQLLVKSATYSVTSLDASISLSTDFLVTDFMKGHALTIDNNESSEVNERKWEYVTYKAWINLNSATTGDRRLVNYWTIDSSDNIILSEWPTGSNTWDANLHYYKTVASFNLSNEPELPVGHHDILKYDVILKFPHLFSGEVLQGAYRGYQNMFNEAMFEFRLRGDRAKKNLKLRPMKYRRFTNLWPESD